MMRRLKAYAALALATATLLSAEASAQDSRGRPEISCKQEGSGVVVRMIKKANDRIGRDVIMRSGWRARIIQASPMTDTLATLPAGARCANNRVAASPKPVKACAMDLDCGRGGQCFALPGYSAPLAAGEGMCKLPASAAPTPAPAASTAPRHPVAACQQRREELDARGWQVHTVGSRAASACAKSAKKELIKVGETTSARHARTKITDCKLIACPR